MIKKNWKKILFIMLIIIISTSIGAYAAYLLNATEVSYEKSDGSTISVKEALDDLYTKALKPKIGDVVNYNANTDSTGATRSTPLTYTTNTTDSTRNDYTGSTNSTTFSTADTMTWKILDINNETGEIKLMPADDSSKKLYLKGRAGYAYSVKILNDISAIYGKGYGAKSARSITVEDINSLTGFDPQKEGYGIHTQTYTSGDYFVNLTYGSGNSGIVTGFNYGEYSTYGKVTADANYNYTGRTYLANTTNSYKMVFRNSSDSGDKMYWLASRCVNFGSSNCDFRVRRVNGGSVGNYTLCYSSNSAGREDSRAVSPVVYLKSNIQLTWDSANNRWNLN